MITFTEKVRLAYKRMVEEGYDEEYAKETASLASSIYIVARKMEREPIGMYNEVKHQLKGFFKHIFKEFFCSILSFMSNRICYNLLRFWSEWSGK